MNQPRVYMCSSSWTHLPPPSHPIPQGHPSTLDLSTMSQALNLDWWSISHMVTYMFHTTLSNHPTLAFSHRVQKSALYICVCFVVSHIGSLLPSFFSSVLQFSSVTQSCPTLWNPMNRSTPGLLVHHQLSEFTQTHVNQVSDAIQPSHPLSSPSPPAPNASQHQSLFQWVNSPHEVAKVLDFQL